MAYFPAAGSSNDPRIGHAEFDLPAIAAGVPYTLTHGLNSPTVNLRFRKNIGGNLLTSGAQGEVQYITWRWDYANKANAVVITPDTAVGDGEIHCEVEAWYGTNDLVAPTAPTIVVGTIASDSIGVTATGGTDAWGIKGYNWFLNGAYVATTYAPAYTYVGLSPSVSYALRCTAIDAAGNESPLSNTINPTTTGVPVAFAAATTVGTFTASTTSLTMSRLLSIASNVNSVAFASCSTTHVNGIDAVTGFTSVTCSSTVGGVSQGAWTKLGECNIGSSKTATLHIFYKLNPAIGDHTINFAANSSASGQWMDAGRMAAVAYGNVVGTPTLVAERDGVTGDVALSATFASAVSRRAVLFWVGDGTPGTVNQTERVNGGAAINGNGDYMMIADAPGAASVSFTSAQTRTHGWIGIDLPAAA